MEIINENHSIIYDAKLNIISCSGSFRLTSQEYIKMGEILNTAADKNPEKITLDLTQLEFLNSSGINMLCKFIIKLRNKNIKDIYVKGRKEFSWQNKTLANFKKLSPNLYLELETIK